MFIFLFIYLFCDMKVDRAVEYKKNCSLCKFFRITIIVYACLCINFRSQCYTKNYDEDSCKRLRFDGSPGALPDPNQMEEERKRRQVSRYYFYNRCQLLIVTPDK